MTTEKTWWKEAIIYQIYPRSFQDTNADGIGDLQGIISRLDYLEALGVDVLWVSPIFKSPNADNGYDVADYQSIMDEFGTMADFEQLLLATHKRGMKLILDLVVNHSSDEHPWFVQARQSKQSPYRDYYIWKNPQPDGSPPNDWVSFFSGSAWEFDATTQQYYLHLFHKKQPDLNWENPKLRQEIYSMMHFWLNKGVDGFRMDVIPFLSKDQTFAPYPDGEFGNLNRYANGPRIHEFLQEMHHEVLSKYDCLSVGEAFGVSAKEANLYVGKNRNELQSLYHFDHAVPREEACFLKPHPEFTLRELKAIIKRWDAHLAKDGWQGVYWGNHDNPRVLSRLGDTTTFRTQSATMLATVLLTLRGTPYIYQGDEIGMSNCIFENITEFDDIQVTNAYHNLVVEQGASESQFLAACNRIARDHARTPMQWDNSPQAGFTTAPAPWLKVNANYHHINVKAQQADANSVLNYYKRLIQFRKNNPVLVYGNYEDLRPRCNRVYAYTRCIAQAKLLIVANFTNKKQTYTLPIATQHAKFVFGNYPIHTEALLQLRPFESRIYQLG